MRLLMRGIGFGAVIFSPVFLVARAVTGYFFGDPAEFMYLILSVSAVIAIGIGIMCEVQHARTLKEIEKLTDIMRKGVERALSRSRSAR